MAKTALIAVLDDGDASILMDIVKTPVAGADAVHFTTANLEC
jgi:hypothetical protein